MERPVRLALISDIHANLEALEATFYDIAERSIDRIVCLGDIVGYNSDAAACIALIRGSRRANFRAPPRAPSPGRGSN
jgi:Icc-related predicted phosphoesterase